MAIAVNASRACLPIVGDILDQKTGDRRVWPGSYFDVKTR
jgi:hypothetical protein